MCASSADLDDSVGGECVFRNHQVGGSRTFADPSGGIVMRAVAGAEVAAKLALHLAIAGTERHTTEVSAHTHGDQPVFLSRLGPVSEAFGIAKRTDIDLAGGRHF